MIDEILEKFGLKFDDLNPSEKETIFAWSNALQKNELTIPKVVDYIASMRESVEKEVSQTSHNSKQDIFLKARLRNYILLEGLLTSPDRAKTAMETMLHGISFNKNNQEI